MNIKNWLQTERLKLAWSLVPAAKKAAVQAQIDAAHQQLKIFHATGTPPPHDPSVPHHLLLAQTAISDDADNLTPTMPTQAVVDSGGAIWGTGKYQQLDPGWLGAAAAWLEHLILGKFAFPSGTPEVTTIPDRFTIAIAGDFGTGNWGTAANPAPSTKIGSKAIPALNPDFTIHLGDVYYEGSASEENNNLISLWPHGAGPGMSYTMNSNHEMYSGAKPFFVDAVGNALFSAQKPYSFFALENTNWVIVGLDSAYYADELTLYLNGALTDPVQLNFLKQQAQKGKKLLLLTHHNGLEEDGSAATGLWNQVMSCFPAGAGPAYWYWGHVHAGAVYKPQKGVLCRCNGHSALPWGLASGLSQSEDVLWFESRNANDPNDTLRVLNGFAYLQFDGANLNETFYDENGGVAWSSPQSTQATTGAG